MDGLSAYGCICGQLALVAATGENSDGNKMDDKAVYIETAGPAVAQVFLQPSEEVFWLKT